MINKNREKIKEQSQIFFKFFDYLLAIILLIWAIIIIYIFTDKNKSLFVVFEYLFLSWHFWWTNCPALEIFLGLAMLGVYWLCGYFLLRCFDVYFPSPVNCVLAFPIGLSLLTVPFMILAIFGALYPPTIAIIFALSLGAGIYLAHRHQHSPLAEVGRRSNAKLFRRSYLFFARQEERLNVQHPATASGKILYYIALALTGIIVSLNFYHSLFYPETYWDSLIYYLGYGRMTFLQHKFPVKVVAQVGLGLGANYPHLFPLLGAVMSTLTGKWSSVFPQLVPPICGLVATVLIYHIVIRITKMSLIAALSTLLFRSVPYGIAFFTYASDYAVAIMFSAGLLYLALMYVETRLWSYLVLSAIICAGAVQINYLMWYLWFGWAIMLIISHWRIEKEAAKIFQPSALALTRNLRPLRLFTLIGSRSFLLLVTITMTMSLMWYVRNILLTGNPVYAFFPQIFDGKNINIDVLRSCFEEWRVNGDGIGRFGATLWEKLQNSWFFFVNWEQSWKLAPVFIAFGLPGFVLALLHIGGGINLFNKTPRKPLNSFLTVAVFISAFLLFYHYCISDIYLYHIVPILVPVAVFSSLVLRALWKGGLKLLAAIICLYVGLMPGLTMSLMGFKFKGEAEIIGWKMSQLQLVALRNPCMPEKMFYRLEFGQDVDMWDYINQNLKGARILSHENRHLVYDPSITFIHLDDWEIQQIYELTDKEKLSRLKEMGISYYLHIPMEQLEPEMEHRKRILEKLGIKRWREEGKFLHLIYEAGENKLYRFNLLERHY